MSDDIIIVERPREARRIVVTAPGRFSFADVRDARGERRVFGCHAVNPSIREIVIASPVTAKMDARVIAYIDHLGKLDGMVTCVLQRGFVMGVNVKQNERRKLAAKIEWLQQHKNSEVREQRADSRFVPKDPYSRMILADGHVETCLVLDVSISGAATSADTIPAIGTVLAVGRLTSRDTVELSLADSDA
jgi:hypothetical protein